MFDTKAAHKRLRAIGITANESHQILHLVQKWIRNSGEEWTVDRVKAIKLDLLRHYCGLPPTKSHTWIRYGGDGAPRGAFGVLFRVPKHGFARAWNAVMVYTGLVFDHPNLRVTTRQWKKAVLAIKRGPVASDALVEGLKWIHTSPLSSLRVTVHATTGDPLLLYPVRLNRRAPSYLRTVPEIQGVVDSLRPLISRSVWTVENWDILSGVVHGLENKIVPDLELNLEFERKAGGELPVEVPEMGIIALIQEAGYKLRFAANPHRVYQQALRPLGVQLFAALKRVPNDFTFDQEGGVDFISMLLQQGFPAASMDLSNATDNAPLELQLALLSKMGVSTRWLQFFKSTCTGDWYVNRTKTRFGWETIRWTVGSPLGLYPTFPAFALWHHSMVQDCFNSLECPKLSDGRWPYAIVGDDVFIGNWEVARLYRSRMESLGVPISEDKTLWSTTTAEFVGRVITANAVIQGVKWKGRVTDESFVDLARNIGPGALLLMTHRQRRVLSFIADLPEPYGLGWNPLGIPLEERLTPEIERLWSRDERVRTFESRASRINRLLFAYADGIAIPGREPEVDDLASDQEASDVVQELLPGWESWGVSIWPNAVAIGLERELSPQLRTKFTSLLQRNSLVESRVEAPTLVVLERKIRRVLSRSRDGR